MPKPECQVAEALSILEAKDLILFKLEAKAKALITKPKPKPGYLYPIIDLGSIILSCRSIS